MCKSSKLILSEFAVPAVIFQTLVAEDGAQDSATPLEVVLKAAEFSGDVRAGFHVVLVRSDLKPVEAFDPVGGGYAPLSLPQETFSFRRGECGSSVVMAVRRKHLPPSKNHGDVLFRFLVRLAGPSRRVAVSTPFRIHSKQSHSEPKREPKRRRNPAPTKPFVAPHSELDEALVDDARRASKRDREGDADADADADAGSGASSGSDASSLHASVSVPQPSAKAGRFRLVDFDGDDDPAPSVPASAPESSAATLAAASTATSTATLAAASSAPPGMTSSAPLAAAASLPSFLLHTGCRSPSPCDTEDGAEDVDILLAPASSASGSFGSIEDASLAFAA